MISTEEMRRAALGPDEIHSVMERAERFAACRVDLAINGNRYGSEAHVSNAWRSLKKEALKLAHSKEWVGLTRDERVDITTANGAMSVEWEELAKDIEAKLKEKNT